MKSFLARFVTKQKLLLGILWLMLRGNGATAQSVHHNGTCYRVGPRATINLQADISLSHQVDFKHTDSQLTTFQFGVNNKWETHGFVVDFSAKEQQWRTGGFLRLFPYDGKKITLMAEFKYMLPIQHHRDNESFSISGGIILSDHSNFGVELFETMATDLSLPSGICFYSGVRIHYYFIHRLCRRPSVFR
ncbi:MAG: hypothetical protein CVU11_14255 [Bacteroidetes bacterium HGW-Bacteroidetes-6]|jgi:hypothetical protein|nr:MAG: hypothetical protein CVU11_14255 [Bacteroidetes bacterium HGW-Bacteroidetes-6]